MPRRRKDTGTRGESPVSYEGVRGGMAQFRISAACSALDAALASGMSRTSAHAAFRAHALTLSGGSILAPETMLQAGTMLEVRLYGPAVSPGVERPSEDAEDAAMAAGVVYEDPFLVVVDKPAGMIVHEDGSGTLTLTDLVRAYERRSGCDVKPQAVQRLDRDTTGLICFSKSKAYQPAFDNLVASRLMEKRYLAIVRGTFPQGKRIVRMAIGRDRHDARRMRISASGKPAETTFVLLARQENCSLVAATLGTGRRHQIRVHLAALGYPIVGDSLYGSFSQRQSGRHRSHGGHGSQDVTTALMLHSWSIVFDHPVTGEHLELSTGMPERFYRLGFTDEDVREPMR